uniref:Auxin response factor n=1 Tax=Cyrtomium guizhouense TaxID=306076 RepID=A0A1X9T684_9MONI|nr:auxin response factor 10 [Cyrtomium guizhouense]
MAERSAEKVWPSSGAGRELVCSNDNGGLDSQLWHACAGAMVHLPQVGSKVIYFPQGHAEHAASLPEFPRTIAIAGTVLCRILSVNFLADTETDEVYARIRLQPDLGADPSDDTPASPPLPEKTTSFAKTLTQSDANNGGGFSVPRYCAETIFPRLDYSEDPPVQIVLAKDVHGAVWRFRHIYRGTPRRHLLTTGWSSFVNQKKLVAGDAIVFLRSASGELCVGVRRSTRGGGVGGGIVGADTSPWHLSSSTAGPPRQTSRWELKPSDSSFDFFGTCTDGAARASRTNSDIVGVANFARNRSRVTAKAVLEAATLAAAGQPFEVVYYPRATISEFCVKANAVKMSLQQSWAPGMRFKMAVETEDASRISWFMGTISKVQEADSVRWPNSPWKMLQVTWDEPDLLQGIARVSPWQVELVSPMQLPPFSLPKKKVRLLQPPELQRDGQGMMGFSMAAFASNFLGHINPWHGLAENASVGMQGARQDRSYGLTISDFRPSNTQPHLFWDNVYNHRDPPMASGGQVSTDLNMSTFGNDGHSSERSHLSTLLTVGSTTSEPALNSNGSSWDREQSSSSKSAPFLLFGKAIDTSQSMKSQPAQMSGRSSSDGQGHEIISDSNQSEALDRMHSFVSSQAHHIQQSGAYNVLAHQEAAFDSFSNEVGTLNWFKEQASCLDKEKVLSTLDSSSNHCKVFKESDDVGRTVDLSMFESYEELHEKLSLMFGVQKAEILGRVVCLDLMGSSRPIGEEPYRDFTKRVKRLKILSESSSESFTR